MRTLATKIALLALLGLGGSALGACSSDFASQMSLAGYRVIGIEASPPEVGPDDSIQLSVDEFYDATAALTYAWSVCLYSVGATEGYDCFDGSLERDLGNEAAPVLDLGLAGLNLRQVLAGLPAFPNEDGTPRTLERGFDIWVKLRSGPACAGCIKIDTVKRLTVRESATQVPNTNPVIAAFDVVGATAPGRTITLRVSTDAPETFTDPASGEEKHEEYLYSWYSSRGEADPTRSFGSTTETKLKLPGDAGLVEVVVAVRDGRGGLTIARQTVEVR